MKELKHIYKASQCCDISDCEFAIEQATKLLKQVQSKNNTALYRRLISLKRRLEHFTKK
jgi:hypothetical protein